MSFSQEMKDFIAAYKTGSDINAQSIKNEGVLATTDATQKKTARDNDPDELELQDKQARATLQKTQADIAAAGARTAYTNAIARQIGKGGPTDPTATGLLPPQGAVPVGQPQQSQMGVLPPSTMDTTTDAYADGGLVPDDDPSAPPGRYVREEPKPPPKKERGVLDVLTQKWYATDKDGKPVYDANGHLVRSYADGGLVPDDDDDDEPQGAVPVTSQGTPENAPTDISARARNAVRAGMAYGANAYGLTGTGAIRTPAQIQKMQMLAQGHGGLTDAEMHAAREAVDPDHKLPDGQRNIAALGSVYQFWANKGEPEKAAKVAFQMLQHYRNASTRYAAIAAHAAQSGDVDLATKAALKAYANVPDGNDLMISQNPDNPKQLIYYFTDAQGNQHAQGVATPDQLASSAMGLAQGGFDKALMAAAAPANPEKPGKAPPGPKAPTFRDREGVLKTVDAAMSDDKSADDDARGKAGQKPRPGYWGDVHAAMTHALLQNPEADPQEAYTAAKDLVTVNPDDKDALMPFKVSTDEDSGDHTLTFKNGVKMKLSPEKFDAVITQRAAALKAADQKQDDEQDTADAPSWWQQRAAPAAGAIGSAVAQPTDQPVFPGGAGGPAVPVDNTPVAPRTDRPYVPFLAGGR